MARNEKKQNKYGEISKKILIGLGLSAAVVSVIVFPGLAYVWDAIDKDVTDYRRSRAAFYRLQRQKLISVKREGKKVKIVLTPKGRKRILAYKLLEWKPIKPKRWDGRWWMVMFDVPESRRSVRELVRRKFTAEGFISIQKSVMVYPYPCQELIFQLREYYLLQPGELYIFQAKVLEGENVLKKAFSLGV